MHSPIAEKPEILKSLTKQWINKNSQISNALTKSDKPLLDSICETVSESVSLCQSQIQIYQNNRTNPAGFGMGASFDLSYTGL